MSMKNRTLSLELIREILLRLPVRSLLPLKCVCKSWLSLISDPQFAISHYDLALAPSHRLLLRQNHFFVESIDIEAPLEENSSALHLPLPPPPPPCNGGDYNKYEILGSCRGIILLHQRYEDELIIWNPSTGIHKQISDFRFRLASYFLYGFGYDPSTKDYLLLLIRYFDESDLIRLLGGYDDIDMPIALNVYIFSFKTNSWKEFDVNVPFKVFNYEPKFGLLFNQTLHWLIFCKNGNIPVIVAFDLNQIQRTEQQSFLEIPLPYHITMEMYELYNLSVLGGCLSVSCSVRGSSKTEIWVMKEYKVQSSWTMTMDIPSYGFSLIWTTEDGGIYVSNNSRLEKINHKGEQLECLAFDDDKKPLCANLLSALYRESLLPLSTIIIRETTEDDKQ